MGTGFVRPEDRALLTVAEDPGTLLAAFERHEQPSVAKWLDGEES